MHRRAIAARFPGMYICSNTDKSGTGASVLEQKHYQICGKRLPIFDACSVRVPVYCTPTLLCRAYRAPPAQFCEAV